MFKWMTKGKTAHEEWRMDLHTLLLQFSKLTHELSNATTYNIDQITSLEKRVATLEERLDGSSKDYS